MTPKSVPNAKSKQEKSKTVKSEIAERKQVEEAARAAEADYRAIFDNAPVGIFQSTVAGRYQKVNSAMAEIYGYSSPEEMVNSVQDIVRQIYVEPSARKKFQSLLSEKGEVIEFENQNRRKDGSIIWTSTNARTVRDAEGHILYYEGFVRDITRRKHTEEELQASENRYHTLFNTMQEGVAINEIVMDERGDAVDYIILDANPAFEKQSIYKIKQAIGSRATELYQMSPGFIQDWWREHKLIEQAAHTEYFHEPSKRWFNITTTAPIEN